MSRAKAAISSLALLFAAALAPSQEKAAYSIDTAKSKMEIHVYKEGAFKMFGHDHVIAAKEITGSARFDRQRLEDSSVRLRISTKSITVLDPGESDKNRQEVQSTMAGEKVLDVAKFPEITFASTGVSGAKR